ncbi:MAG TPA: alanine--tRNA ligase-related protein [bacterium]|nr:alanine--tRNA ligase-related protein [bacterium]
MNSDKIRQQYSDFFKQRGHAEIPNVPLLPENDPTLLFVNSGMFPLVPYLLGETHPQGKRLCNFQKSIRVQDIEEVGDDRHTTFFEMMGNWSLGDYFKAEQLPWFMELYHEVFGLDINRLFVSVFEGDADSPRDEESIGIWQDIFAKYGIKAKVAEKLGDMAKNFDPQGNWIDPTNSIRIFPMSKKENWWQRGSTPGEVGGPDSEMFYDFGPGTERFADPHYEKWNDTGRFLEIGNSVFLQYQLDDQLKWQQLTQKNVDFGGGFERVLAAIEHKPDIFQTELFQPLIQRIEVLTGTKYEGNKPSYQVICDHLRAATFIMADGVLPSNKDQGYILRRLIRRAIRHGRLLGLFDYFTHNIANTIIEEYKTAYPHLDIGKTKEKIKWELNVEEEKFVKTVDRGVREISKAIESGEPIDGAKAFYFFETYGFPLEQTVEELKNAGRQLDESTFKQEFSAAQTAHQDQSRAGAEQKFKGGLGGHTDQHVRYHTATHLLNAALKKVLGDHVHQKGSNITPERLRFDFSHPDKMTDEQKQQVEKMINDVITADLQVSCEDMTVDEAKTAGAEGVFDDRYAEKVKVYTVQNPQTGEIFSKEICGGPHVSHTGELNGTFRIKKEESSSAGVRRIKAVLT